ncbi:MAG: hypothetical protein OEM52_03475 [bacterium]|nr:hypothetical protein [bacterium]
MALFDSLKSIWSNTKEDPQVVFTRRHFVDVLKPSTAKKTLSFLSRGARSLRLRGLTIVSVNGSKMMQAEIEDWPFPPIVETTNRFQLVVSNWCDGEEQRSTTDVTIPTDPESIPGTLQFPLPERVVITKMDFLARPDPAKPLLYHFTKDAHNYQTPVLEISRQSFRFRLPIEMELADDGELVSEGYFAVEGEQSTPITCWWKRVGKMLIESEIESIKPKHLSWLIEYLRERFFAQEMIWDGMHVAESLLDEDSPGVRLKRTNVLSQCKALWVSGLPPFTDWFPGTLEVPSKWQNRNPEAIALEYDAIVGTSDELKEWLTLEPPPILLENCAIIELVTDKVPLYPHTLDSVSNNNPLPLDWLALFGWNGRFGEASPVTVYLYNGTRPEQYRYAKQLSKFGVALQWLRKSKLPSQSSNILFHPNQYTIVKKLLDAAPNLPDKHKLWVVGESTSPWIALDIPATGDLSEWILSVKKQ